MVADLSSTSAAANGPIVNDNRATKGSSTRSLLIVFSVEETLLFQKFEGPERAALGHMREIGIGSAGMGAADSAAHRHILRSVVLPRHGLPDDPGRRLELPKDPAVVDVDGNELAGEFAGEDEPAGRHQRARPVRALEAGLPLGFPRHRIDRL